MTRLVPGLLVLLALVAGGCAMGSAPPPTTAPTGTALVVGSPSSPAGADPSPAGPSLTPAPSSSPAAEVGTPPVATLALASDPDGTTWPGALGTFVWDGAGSDSPWFVPSSGFAAPAGSRLVLAFQPPSVAPGTFRVRWATPDAGLAGAQVASADAVGGDAIVVPSATGVLALQVEGSFSDGRQAAWYWRVEVTP